MMEPWAGEDDEAELSMVRGILGGFAVPVVVNGVRLSTSDRVLWLADREQVESWTTSL